MGCATSKLDDLPAVVLCRQRCEFLDQAIQQRYILAEAHVAYIHSLNDVGLSLHKFFDRDLDNSTADLPSPVLNLPTKRKGDPEPSGSPKAAIHHSHSSSGSHLHFHSGSDDDDDSGSDSLHHHLDDSSSPMKHPYGQLNYADHETLGSYPGGSYPGGSYSGGFMNMNYMKNKATQSVSYEQRPMSTETVQMGESSSSYYPYPYSNQTPSGYSYYDTSNYGGGVNGYAGGGGMNGFFGSSPPYGSSSQQLPPVGAMTSSSASSSKTPPPPPSPPSSSAWDFLNPFETYEKYYPPYTPSRDSREVREEEGIPDLEDEDYQQEVVKEVDGDHKFMDGGGGGKNYAKAVVDDDGKVNDSEAFYHTRPSVSMENHGAEYEVHVVDKKVVDNEEKSGDRGNVPAFKAGGRLRGDSEVVREIKVGFEGASASGEGLSKMLEAGKYPHTHRRKNASYQVSSKMLHAVTPSMSVVTSQASTSKTAESASSIEKADPAYLDIGEDVGMKSGNLSSTLQKLYLWEKKLYEEVKVEEKMRVLHERKSRRLKRLDEKGAEAHKVDTTRTLVRSLSTKIRIAIQVVDKISVKINKLRDEELWPQLNEFIQGLTKMWKSMLECHHSQCEAIGEAKRLDSIASGKHFSDARLEATLQLEHELLNWTLRFSSWVGAQKGYVKALNNWLLKCLLYEPEDTDDGIAPFSPGRIGAPPVFVICNQWSQALESISEKEVVDSMRNFASSVLQLWERDKQEMRHRMTINKDTERQVKHLERQDQKIHQEIQALDKKIVLVSGVDSGLSVTGQVVYQSDTSNSIQVSLQLIFGAMERFTANSLKVYEDLLQRIEEDGLAGGH
ncbi:protein ALTERED PHOSPHATE STARVATION RESPONSE 1-like [Cornus florida]|uniref:protein ALTERED PHOSPHATE STARVATION RESPONSE 1-like n=1 Tax=Cornus florida TaxID=4283 RepID=UPI00289B200F|nr:protein ALTERED PHOSPHATE STARVATION RESPONSE 1-like [Cornus florida]